MARRRDRKPILWAFSLSRLDDLLAQVVPSYADAAEIRVFHEGFGEAIETSRRLMQAGEEVDVFISAGANGAYLREHATVPLVMITPTGFDMFEALATARRISSRIALVTHGQTTPEIERFKQAFDLAVEQRAYDTVEEAEARVRELAARGIEVVIGPSVVADVADRAGLKGIYLYSQNAVRDAIARAIEIARVAHAEEAKRERMDAILRHVQEAVVAVDLQERIQSLNPAMERILRVGKDQAVGLPLSRVAPELGLARVLATGDAELEEILRLGTRTLVTNRIPIQEQGVRTGAVLTCQEASAIERVDRSLRSRHRPRRFVTSRGLADVIGTSPAIARARALAERFGRTDATVLVTGESGTGKELFAQGVHEVSARRDRPFVAVNCAALPESLLESELFGYEEGAFTGSRRGGKPGLFESAHTGTIFLDEIGDMPLPLQTRLLRVLQEREVLRLGAVDATPVDVRVVAATNRDLERRVEAGAFREDLYYRLAILKLRLPPLSERREDIPLIAAHLLDRAFERHHVTAARSRVLRAILPRLEAYAWPGNVREMENVLERLSVLYAGPDVADYIGEAEVRAVVPELFGGDGRAERESLRAVRSGNEREHVLSMLRECGGDQREAARRLGIGRTTLWRKLKAPPG